FCMENPANDVLPAGIIRMRLTSIDNLERSGVLGNLPETIEIGQYQISALVSCCTSSETYREHFGIKLEAGLLANRLEQIVFGDAIDVGAQAERQLRHVE